MNLQPINSWRAKQSFKKSVMLFILLAATWTPKAIAEEEKEPVWKEVIKCYSGLSTKSNVARKMTKFADIKGRLINQAPKPEGFIMPSSKEDFFYFDQSGIYRCKSKPKKGTCVSLNFALTEKKEPTYLPLVIGEKELSVGINNCAEKDGPTVPITNEFANNQRKTRSTIDDDCTVNYDKNAGQCNDKNPLNVIIHNEDNTIVECLNKAEASYRECCKDSGGETCLREIHNSSNTKSIVLEVPGLQMQQVQCSLSFDQASRKKVYAQIKTSLSDVYATYEKEMSAYNEEIAAQKNPPPGTMLGGIPPKAPDQWGYVAALDQCTDVIGLDQVKLINSEKRKFPDFQQNPVPVEKKTGIEN
jgi:hypothetical protein